MQRALAGIVEPITHSVDTRTPVLTKSFVSLATSIHRYITLFPRVVNKTYTDKLRQDNKAGAIVHAVVRAVHNITRRSTVTNCTQTCGCVAITFNAGSFFTCHACAVVFVDLTLSAIKTSNTHAGVSCTSCTCSIIVTIVWVAHVTTATSETFSAHTRGYVSITFDAGSSILTCGGCAVVFVDLTLSAIKTSSTHAGITCTS